ncbi:Succinate dehydrogenase/fumarate reductase, flavoprotein subunit [Sphingobium sp. AP50]|uniref:FAD-dependent oxidoreductase n=1 Tax=Sphingobium sp. AP50 TaxID=1884369 RepID=UPI0008D61DF8|nr:FAD-dependent oxidoreductase [Sphingobium sp. AP50]SEK05160.1 Succinate dehydrogenase/fumarate reductase, flavoprotein subunit [Sphingobium sp. AP50]
MPENAYDLIIAGSGAAGLSTAIIAHSRGLRVAIVEKTHLVGGTTSYSGGVVWIPNSRQNVATGLTDTLEAAEQYLDSTVSTSHEHDGRRAYLERGPEAFAYLESLTGPLFYVRAINSPDYFPEAAGASQKGRAMTPISVDGRMLGERFNDIRPPLPELCLFGRQMLELMDVYHLLNARRSAKSALHTGRLLLRDVRDRVLYRKYGRGTRLTGGNALVANLYKSALDRGIPILRNSPIVELIRNGDHVAGVVVKRNGRREKLHAARGVVLATGGFPWSKSLRNTHMNEAEFGYSATSPDSSGDGIALATAIGAKFDTANVEGAFWTPVSVGTRKDGSVTRFPHLMADRAKPGLIAVNKSGERFFNEAENYHDFVRAMLGRLKNEDQQPVHLLCDATFMRKYAFGAVPPLASERRRAVRSGYLIEASTIDALADKIGVDRHALNATIAEFNRDAEHGIDTKFGKGKSAYNRYLGDSSNKPNPCLGPLDKAPFYAIRVHAGDIGTTYGLAADLHSRVLDEQGQPIKGLYACGNDRNSVMGGFYPSGGITIGPALTFAYLAAMHAAGAEAGSGPFDGAG